MGVGGGRGKTVTARRRKKRGVFPYPRKKVEGEGGNDDKNSMKVCAAAESRATQWVGLADACFTFLR